MVTEGPKVTLNFIVDKAKQKVLFAEAGHDFVDILFSFLTLPLGTIVRLLGKNVESQRIGSLNVLYDSVTNLEIKHFAAESFKDMLLNPRNSADVCCQKLAVNVDDTEPKYFFCGLRSSTEAGVFVCEMTSFIITDDLHVMPNSLDTSVALLNQLGIQDTNVLQEMNLSFGLDKILELLNWSLVTKNPLTNVVFGKTHISSSPACFEASSLLLPKMVSEKTITSSCPEMTVKVLVQKSKKKVLYAQAEEDFINFLFSFLTIPLGRVEYLLGCNSSLESINNLYNSISNLNSGRYFKSEDLKTMLLCPKLAPLFLCKNQILPLDEANDSNLYCPLNHHVTTLYDEKAYQKGTLKRLSYRCPKKPNTGSLELDGFVRRCSATFMVTDDLAITPMSSVSAISKLSILNVPLGDVEFQVMSIDSLKALAILRASLGSTLVFTDCLDLFLKKPKDEPV